MASPHPADSLVETNQTWVGSSGIPGQARLTPREIDVLRQMAEGLTTKQIAFQLNIRFKTAACHRNRILDKLGVQSTVLAVRWAIRHGLVEV